MPVMKQDIISFNNVPSSLVCSIPKYSVLIIGADRNVQRHRQNEQILLTQLVKQKWGISDFSLENQLALLNPKFQKKEENVLANT